MAIEVRDALQLNLKQVCYAQMEYNMKRKEDEMHSKSSAAIRIDKNTLDKNDCNLLWFSIPKSF